jgi:hypothetical protein
MSIERMAELTEQIDALTIERYEIGKSLPPVTLDEVEHDHDFVESVRTWVHEWMTPIDTTLLDREDYEKWELLTRRHGVSKNGDGAFAVWDAHDQEYVGEPTEHEDEAREIADNLEDEWQAHFHGFPFAWNTGWLLEGTHWLDELSQAGFLVYRYDGDTIIAGIDGGGYSFMDAHFKPLYAALAEKHGWMVGTINGPRRIVAKKEVSE